MREKKKVGLGRAVSRRKSHKMLYLICHQTHIYTVLITYQVGKNVLHRNKNENYKELWKKIQHERKINFILRDYVGWRRKNWAAKSFIYFILSLIYLLFSYGRCIGKRLTFYRLEYTQDKLEDFLVFWSLERIFVNKENLNKKRP